MNSERLRTFHRVARIGSFRRAAEDLHLSQPAVSKQIRALEAELGAQLFERGHSVRLTPAGETLVGYAERMDGLLRAAKDELSDLARVDAGQLRVGLTHSASLQIIPRTVARYRARFPGVGLYLETNWASTLAQNVSRNELDLAIVGLLEPAEQAMPDLECRVLAERAGVFVTSAACPLVTTPNVTIEQARALPWVVNQDGCQFRGFLEDLLRTGGGGTPHWAAEIVGIELQRQLVLLGLGAGMFVESVVADEIASGALVPFTIGSLQPRVRLCLLHRKAKYVHHAMRNFLAMIDEDVAALPHMANVAADGARPTRKNGRVAQSCEVGILEVPLGPASPVARGSAPMPSNDRRGTAAKTDARIENARPSRG